MLHYFRVVLISCYTFSMLHFLHVILFSSWTFFRVALFSSSTFFILHLFSYGTLLKLHLFRDPPSHFFRVLFFSWFYMLRLADARVINMTWDWKLWGRDNFFGFFSHLFSPLDFKHFSVFYGILSKFLPLFLFWYPSFNNIRNFVCYLLSRFTGNGINIIKTKRN